MKKPILRLLKVDNPKAIDIGKLYEKLTGKPMTKEELQYAQDKFK